MRATKRLRAARKLALVLAATGVLAVVAGVAPAEAATTSDLLYSVDGGATWSSSVTAAPGQTVQVRQWFSNDGSSNETEASVRTTVPAGFTLVGGSTEVCLNPSTTNPTAPDAAELRCTASDETAVWSGSDLQVSPRAGHYGESNATTEGELASGRKRYLNLQQCSYQDPGSNWFSSAVPAANGGTNFDAATNVANTPTTALTCGPAGSGWGLSVTQSGFEALDLLGRRYLNLHQCAHATAGGARYVGWLPNSAGGTGRDAYTNTSNTADTAYSCGPPFSGQTFLGGSSGVSALDLTAGRYLNLQQCTYLLSGVWMNVVIPTPYDGSGMDAITDVSATPRTANNCGPAPSGWTYQATASDFLALDLLDTARSAGYVSYSLTAPAAPTAAACAAGLPNVEDFAQTGELLSLPSGTQSSDGTLSVDWTQATDPCGTTGTPMVDLRVGAATLVALAGGALVVRRRIGSTI